MANPSTKIKISAEDKTKAAFLSVQRSLDSIQRSSQNLSRTLGGLSGGFQAVVGAIGVRTLVDYADTYTSLSNKLKNAVGDTEDFANAQKDVFRIAQSTGTGLSETADLYAKIARNAKQIGLDSSETSKVVETFNKTLKISGATTSEASAAVLQFGQALASGRLQGDELRSLLENNNRFAVAIADSLGITIGKLRELGSEGALSAELVTKALLQQSSVIDKEFGDATDTVATGLTRLNNAFILMVGNFEKETGAFQKIASFLTIVAQNLDVVIAVAGTAAAAAVPLLIARIAIALKALGGVISRNPLVVTAAALSSLIAGLTVFKGDLEKLGGMIKEFFGFGPEVKESTQELEDFANATGSALKTGIDLSSKQLKNLSSQNALLKSQLAEYLDIIQAGKDWNASAVTTNNLLKATESQYFAITEAMRMGVSLTQDQIRKFSAFNGELQNGEAAVDRLVKSGVKLTAEQKKQLALLIDNKNLQELIEKVLKNQNDEAEKQINKQMKLAQTVVNGIRAAGPQAQRFFDLIGLQVKRVGDEIKLAFETNPAIFLAKLVLSSKKVSSAIEGGFEKVGNTIDSFFGGVDESSREADQRMQELIQTIKTLSRANEDLLGALGGISDQEKALLQIERDRQDQLENANSLNSSFAVYLANSNAELKRTAYFLDLMRSATQAFTATAQTFLDAVATEGFTNLQKQLFSTLKSFEDVAKNYNDIVAASREVLSQSQAQKAERQRIIAQAALVPQDVMEATRFFMKEENLNKVPELFASLSQQFQDAINRAIKKEGPLYTANLYGVLLNGGLDDILKISGTAAAGIPALDAAIAEANSTISDFTSQMDTARAGLMIIIKDILRTSYEQGTAMDQLRTDAKILSDRFASAGISINDLLSYIDTLPSVTVGAQAAMGGMVAGPLHTNGGVRSYAPGGPIELEGGEYVMRRDAVKRYGQTFMDAINKGQWANMGGSPNVEVSIYDGTGQRISEYDSALRVEIKERAARNNKFPAVA